jgi:hypothetical protein
MINVKESTGKILAADTSRACYSIDSALLDSTALITSIVEGGREIQAPMNVVQMVLTSASEAVTDFVSGRAKLTKMVGDLTRIQGKTTLKEVSFGCPRGMQRSAESAVKSEENYSIS